VLGKDTLSLFVDDGLQVGRYRWIKVDKVEGMRRYGDVQAALEEDKAACLEEGLGPTFPDDAPPTGAQSRTRAARSPNQDPMDPICPDHGDGKQNWSPEDHRDLDDDDERDAGPLMHISPGVDLLIKMHDLFLAIKRFNLRLSARKLYAYRDSVDYLGFHIARQGIRMKEQYGNQGSQHYLCMRTVF
jgi:hypothetical protein